MSSVSIISDEPSQLFNDTPETRVLYGRDIRLNDLSVVSPDDVFGITHQELRDIDINIGIGGDLKTAAGRHDVAQALISRIRTRRGELAWEKDIIHTRYGCDVWRMLGEANTPLNRNQARSYVAESLIEDPRVQSISEITITFFDTLRNYLFISASIVLIGSQIPLNLVFEVA